MKAAQRNDVTGVGLMVKHTGQASGGLVWKKRLAERERMSGKKGMLGKGVVGGGVQDRNPAGTEPVTPS